MSQENVDLVLRACAAWQRFEPEEIASFYAADVEIVSIWAEVFGRTFHGRDGLLKWIRDFSAAFERPDLEYEHVADAGDQVVVLEHVRTRGRTSEAEVSLKLAHVYTVRDGLIARQVLHEDLAEALEAVALRGSIGVGPVDRIHACRTIGPVLASHGPESAARPQPPASA